MYSVILSVKRSEATKGSQREEVHIKDKKMFRRRFALLNMTNRAKLKTIFTIKNKQNEE